MCSAAKMPADSLEYSSEQGGSDYSQDHARDNAYEEGMILTFRAHDLEDRLVTVRILKVYRPFFYSCVMKVEILHGLCKTDRIPERAVVKLYDRRFAAKLRSEHKIRIWSPEIEEKYINLAHTSSATDSVTLSRQTGSRKSSVMDRDEAQNEVYVQNLCSDAMANEMEVYQRLKILQGKHIPKIYSAVTTIPRDSMAGMASATKESPQLFHVRGILMEHIVGPALTQIPDFIPPEHWQSLVEGTLKLILKMHSLGVVNEEIKAANVIVNPTYEQNAQHKIFMINLARCTVRPKHQSDEDWTKLKTELNQEGAIVRAMSVILRRVGFALQPVAVG